MRSTHPLWRGGYLCRRPQADVSASGIVDLRLGKDGEDGLVSDQDGIGVGVPGGQMNQAAVDASLKGVCAAYAVYHAVPNLLASILHLFDARSEDNCYAG